MLIDCPECKSHISEKAFSCPKCGCPITNNQASIPNCPTCGSVDVEKISLKSKIGAGLAVGFFALGHITKTFKCNSCGSKW